MDIHIFAAKSVVPERENCTCLTISKPSLLPSLTAATSSANAPARCAVPAPRSRRSQTLGITSTYRIQSWVKDIPPANPRRRVRAKDEVRAQARELRRQGRTYTEIAAELGVSKSSCSLWCDDMPRPAPRPGKKRGPSNSFR